MGRLIRAITYASLFVAVLLVLLPSRLLDWTGVTPPAGTGPMQVIGVGLGAAGAALVVWCILTFVFVGRGTQAPFDPPRRLVVTGPYRVVRNPMYMGAALALLGAALFYRSAALLGYAALFLAGTHLFVVRYEEPTLRGTFGHEYEAYCSRVRRWWPHVE